MPKSAAERQRERRARVKADSSLNEQVKQRERDRWQRRVAQHKVKTIADMSAREQRYQRKKWRQKWNERQTKRKMTTNEAAEVESVGPHFPVTPSSSRQKLRGRQLVRRDRAAAYRHIAALKQRLYSAQKTISRLRKRELRSRMQRNREADSKTPDSLMTPRKLVEKTMSSPRKNRKALLLHYSVMSDFGTRLKSISGKQRKVARSVLCATQLVKKHRLQSFMRKSFGIPRMENQNSKNTEQKMSKRSVLSEIKKDIVRDFFEQDTVSRATSGKKETVTRQKKKMQKRFLLEPVNKLHKTFQKEHNQVHISRAAFAKNKPFWVKRPSIQDRDTCLCTVHENTRLLHEKLKALKLTTDKRLSDTVCKTTCEMTSKSCMYNECNVCANQQPIFETSYSDNHATSWWNWQQVTLNAVNGKRRRRTVKMRVSGSVAELKKCFIEQLRLLKPHMFRMIHQMSAIKSKRSELADHEVLLHVDFSENFTTKNLSEVQSAHFGSSLRQITLHTGVIYSSTCKPLSFCTISDNCDHGAVAVWSHLLPVLRFIKQLHPHVSVLHMVSDGPTTQYRNRMNMYLCTIIPHLLGFKLWWNFSEAGHGKSAADGVGGTVKRLSDSRVLAGDEIQNASQLYNCLRDITVVKLFLVNQFIDICDTIKIPPVPGTMKIHQFTAHCDGTVMYRDLTCYCNSVNMCGCYKAKVVNLSAENPSAMTLPEESSAEQLTACTFNELEILNTECSIAGVTGSLIVYQQDVDVDGTGILSSVAGQVSVSVEGEQGPKYSEPEAESSAEELSTCAPKQLSALNSEHTSTAGILVRNDEADSDVDFTLISVPSSVAELVDLVMRLETQQEPECSEQVLQSDPSAELLATCTLSEWADLYHESTNTTDSCITNDGQQEPKCSGHDPKAEAGASSTVVTSSHKGATSRRSLVNQLRPCPRAARCSKRHEAEVTSRLTARRVLFDIQSSVANEPPTTEPETESTSMFSRGIDLVSVFSLLLETNFFYCHFYIYICSTCSVK